MAWQEWEQLKPAAAEGQSTQMQLNRLPAAQGGTSSGGGDGAGGPWGGGGSGAASSLEIMKL